MVAPWRGKWDFKVLQDYNFKVGASKSQYDSIGLDV
jgi:hypothetical protein